MPAKGRLLLHGLKRKNIKKPKKNKNYKVKITSGNTSETPGQSLTCLRSV